VQIPLGKDLCPRSISMSCLPGSSGNLLPSLATMISRCEAVDVVLCAAASSIAGWCTTAVYPSVECVGSTAPLVVQHHWYGTSHRRMVVNRLRATVLEGVALAANQP
jgi:hypothetical protein